MIGFYIGMLLGFAILVRMAWAEAYPTTARFPKGHIREYDPDGIYTYKDQNPRFK
jgi:hypothetical protein